MVFLYISKFENDNKTCKNLRKMLLYVAYEFHTSLASFYDYSPGWSRGVFKK